MRGFIAGAISTGRPVASRTADARSSGAAGRHLGHEIGGGGRDHDEIGSRASRMWPTSNSVSASNRSVNTRSPDERAGRRVA